MTSKFLIITRNSDYGPVTINRYVGTGHFTAGELRDIDIERIGNKRNLLGVIRLVKLDISTNGNMATETVLEVDDV